MTKQELEYAKQELKDYIYNKELMKEKENDMQEKRELLDKITNILSDMPKGNTYIYDKQAERLAEVLDLTEELEKDLKDLEEKQLYIETKIKRLGQPYRNILYFRHIRGYNLTEVSDKIEKEYDYTRKLYGRALKKYVNLGGKNGQNNSTWKYKPQGK